MEKSISMDIPEQWFHGIDWHQTTVVREIVQLGVLQYKVRLALDMYRSVTGSLGYVAEEVGLSKRRLIREARVRGIESDFDEQTLREELGE